MIEFLDRSLLKGKYKEETGHPSAGHCYIAAEALYHFSGKENGYYPMVMRVEGGTHWFLSNGTDILDPTVGQFDTTPDYSKGRRCGFLTKQPSKRAMIVLKRMRGEENV